MIIDKAKLQEALEIVKPGLANKEIVEQFTSFAFINGRIVTYNDEISISHPVENLEIEGAVKADKLYPLLSKIKKDEVEIDIVKNEIILKSGKIKAGLSMQSEVTLPLDEEIAQRKKWKALPENFVKFLNFAAGSCSRDSTKSIYCVHVQEKGFIEGTDNYRLTKCDLSIQMPVKTFLIPAPSALQVVRVNPTKIAEGNGWIHFKNDFGTQISCRLFSEDEFQDTSNFSSLKGIRLVLPKTIRDALDRASVFSKMDNPLEEEVIISISDRRFKMRAEASTGWYEEEINLKYNGNPLVFAITPSLLKGILAETGVCEYTKNKLKFEGEGWFHITALREIAQ